MEDEDFLQQFPGHAALLRRCLGAARPTEAEVRAILQRTVGSESALNLMQRRSFAEERLTSGVPNMRCAALIALTHCWGPSDRFKNDCERVALSDAEPTVRKCALASFFLSYVESDPARVGKVAALLTYDNSQPRELRMDAYSLLVKLYMRKRLTAWYPLAPDSPGFRFPEDVEWKFVDGFLYPETRDKKSSPMGIEFGKGA